MKKILLGILLSLSLAIFPATAFATPVSWDKVGNVLQPLQSSWTDIVKVPSITATSTTATSTLLKTDISGPGVSILGEYFTNFTTKIRSLFSAGTGISLSSGQITNTGVTSIIAGTNVTVDHATGAVTINSTASGGGSGTISTSSALTAPQVIYATGASTVASAATSTLTGTSPISVSNNPFIIGGSSAAITIANAAADGSTKGAASFTAADFDASSGNISLDYTNGQKASGSLSGFLSSTDWTTFNGKESTLTFSWPLVRSTNTISWDGIATSTTPSIGNLAYWTGVKTLGTVATSTPTVSSPLAYSGTLGSFVGGSGGAFSIANAVADGSTKGAASFTAADFDGSSGNISIDYTNGQAASGSTKGFLASADWTTFNNKAATGTCTNQFARALGASSVTCATVSLTADVTGTLPVANGGTGAATFGQGWIYSNGGTGALAASTSPTVAYLTATSTATSTFAGGIKAPCFSTDGTNCISASTNYWTLSGSKLYNNSGTFAGIGTTTPDALFTVDATSSTAFSPFRVWAPSTYALTTVSTTTYTSGQTWNKPANLVSATIYVYGGGGGGAGSGSTAAAGNGGDGAASSFTYNSGGNTIQANGGTGGVGARNTGKTGVGGTASGGTTNTTGTTGSTANGGGGAAGATGCSTGNIDGSGGAGGASASVPQGGKAYGGGGGGGSTASASPNGQGGGGGGCSVRTVLAASLGSTETIVVGGGGGGGGSSFGGAAGNGGNASGATGGSAGSSGNGNGAAGAGGNGGANGNNNANGDAFAGTGGAGGAVVIVTTVSTNSTTYNTALSTGWVTAVTGGASTSTPAFGIGTSTPSATLSVQGAWGAIVTMISTVINGTSYIVEQIDKFGHLVTGGPAPTANSCAGFSISGNDRAGTVTFTSATSCSITFANAYTATPTCIITPYTTASTVALSAISTTGFAASFGTAQTKFGYICNQ